MKYLHFARFLQNDKLIIRKKWRFVKIKLSHFAKKLQNNAMSLKSIEQCLEIG